MKIGLFLFGPASLSVHHSSKQRLALDVISMYDNYNRLICIVLYFNIHSIFTEAKNMTVIVAVYFMCVCVLTE